MTKYARDRHGSLRRVQPKAPSKQARRRQESKGERRNREERNGGGRAWALINVTLRASDRRAKMRRKARQKKAEAAIALARGVAPTDTQNDG